ncbi:MAG: HI0074 family nucleotidyltransferase substrate-binding subunit [Lachnospiraceae bacterium]|nr:HI0074 family nucleotidyltransferase substrate-binding subunit [Lachnospiraceae bacterium]
MKKFDNFCRALNNLKDIYKYEKPYENVILTGLVALYEICFEQSWKAMKEILEYNGFAEAATGSPRQILKTAYKAGIIKDEKLWLDALVSRNNVAHAYNQAVALDIVQAVKDKYYEMFEKLKEEIEKNWS